MVPRIFKSFAVAAALILPCFAGVNVSSPANNSTVTNPAHFVASANSNSPVTAMAIYVDNNLVTKVGGASINTNVSMSGGRHNVVVQAWDATGAVQKTALAVNVSGNPGPGPGPISGNAFNDIDQLPGWQNCGACAGPGGHGVPVPYSMTQYRSSPSIDGKSAEFWIGGRHPYSSALWWKQLGARPGASHLVYDLYFYVTNPSAPQALEFDINQSVNGRKYIFGTECSPRGSGQWDVWNTAGHHWVPTGIRCIAPSAYTWHHVTIEVERAGASTHFVAITLDGRKNYVNRYFNTYGSGGAELNVAVQLDTNYASTNYSIWTDRMSLRY